MTLNQEENLINKVELSHLAISKTISDYGDQIRKNNNEIIELKTIVKDFIKHSEKLLDSHENKIGNLEISDTEIRSAFKSGKWVAGLASIIVISLIGTITTMGVTAYNGAVNGLDEKINKIEIKNEKSFSEIMKYLQAVK